MATFTVQKGYSERSKVEIKEGTLVIGRDPEVADFVIDSGDVSRKHVRVKMEKSGKVTVEDMGSSNGTFVNSVPLDSKVELKHMDIVQIGKNVLMFNDADTALVSDKPKSSGKSGAMKTSEFYTFKYVSETIKKIEENIGKVIIGKPDAIRNLIVCLFADGHILIEDAPGVGKSVLAQALAKSIQGSYKRIQFTPDMLPSDITGVSIYDEKVKEFSFLPGPIFGNIILADEINRTTPRTQSSLLECMSESVMTIDGKTHVLPKPFFVVATQNPSDYHGTYPLPEPQLDRFMMRISIGYPDQEAEMKILDSQAVKHPLNDISFVVNALEVLQCQAQVRRIHISEPVKQYIVKIADATRQHPALATGCSPRASLALMRMSQSLAAYHGREYVIPRDVRELVHPVMGHRMTMKLRAQGEWDNTKDVLTDILEKIPMENEDKIS